MTNQDLASCLREYADRTTGYIYQNEVEVLREAATALSIQFDPNNAGGIVWGEQYQNPGRFGVIDCCSNPISFLLTNLDKWQAVAISAILNVKEDV